MKPITIIAICVICAATLMSGCVAPEGTWDFDGTLKHVDDENESTPSYPPTPIRPQPTPTPDPCIGVICSPECYGVDLYRTNCVDGICIRGDLLEEDSLRCGYVIPPPAPTPVPTAPTVPPTPCPIPIHTPAVEPTSSPLEVHSGGCEGLDQNVLRRYDHNNNGMIDINEMEDAKTGYESNYEKPSDYAQILYAYEHSCPVCPAVSPAPGQTPRPTFANSVVAIDPTIYSGVVRNNGEILDIRITPDPLIADGDLRIEIDVLNTGTTTTCYELEWEGRDPERWIYVGDMETFVFTSTMGSPGDRDWLFELYWDAEWPASNVLLQTATAHVRCYTQYEIDNM